LGLSLIVRIEKLFVSVAAVCLGFFQADRAVAGDTPAPENDDASAAAQAAVFVPPEDGYDWIQLTSGEWLKGEVIGLFDDKVEFDSDILDELVLDAEDVNRFYSPRTFGISIRGYELLSGHLRIDEQTVFVTTDGQVQSFPREQLLAVTVSAERERDRWSGELTLGMNVRQGNTDLIEYNAIAGLERRTPRTRAFIDYIGSFNETEGVRVDNNHRVNIVFDKFSGTRVFWRPFVGQYFRDPFQNIEHQFTLETGVGYEIMDTNRTEWDVWSAVGVNDVRRVSVESGQPSKIRSPALSLGTDFDTELTSWLDYLFTFQMTFLDEESGDYQHHLLTTLSTDLVRNIDFDVSLIWDRTQSPPPDATGEFPEKDDFRLMVGISFDF
jgi:hypothetical protein